MKSNTDKLVRRTALAIVVSALAAPIALAAPAAGSNHTPADGTPRTVQRSDDLGVVLRRDGSKAVPFVANVGPEATETSDGFDWGDAGIGATATLALGSIAAGAALVLARRPRRGHTPSSA